MKQSLLEYLMAKADLTLEIYRFQVRGPKLFGQAASYIKGINSRGIQQEKKTRQIGKPGVEESIYSPPHQCPWD